MKILVWNQNRALGDGIVFSGVPKAIKELWPDAQVDVYTTKMHAGALKYNPNIHQIFHFATYTPLFRRVPQQKLFTSLLANIKSLLKAKREKYDYIIDVVSSTHPSNIRMLKFIKADNTSVIGMYYPDKSKKQQERAINFYTTIGKYPNITPLGIFGLPGFPFHDIHLPKEKEQRALAFYQQHNDKNKIIFNGDGSGYKTIPAKKVLETLSCILNSDDKAQIFILDYKPLHQKYEQIISELSESHPGRVCFTYPTDVYDSFALVKHADLLITVDTAIMHAADAMATKVLVIYGHPSDNYKTDTHPHKTTYLEVRPKENSQATTLYIDSYDSQEVAEHVGTLLGSSKDAHTFADNS